MCARPALRAIYWTVRKLHSLHNPLFGTFSMYSGTPRSDNQQLLLGQAAH